MTYILRLVDKNDSGIYTKLWSDLSAFFSIDDAYNCEGYWSRPSPSDESPQFYSALNKNPKHLFGFDSIHSYHNWFCDHKWRNFLNVRKAKLLVIDAKEKEITRAESGRQCIFNPNTMKILAELEPNHFDKNPEHSIKDAILSTKIKGHSTVKSKKCVA